jgi:hypothetical protein
VPNSTIVIGSGIVTGPVGIGVTVATAVTVAVAVPMTPVGVEVTVAVGSVGGVGVEVTVGAVVAVAVEVTVGGAVGSSVGVSPAGGSCAWITAGMAANESRISAAAIITVPTCKWRVRFIERLLLMMTGAELDA